MAKKSSKTNKQDNSKAWSVFSLVSAFVAANVVKQVLDVAWRAATGKKPPSNPADPDVRATEAISWAVVSAAAIAVARLVANRKAANYYRKSTGSLPPGVKSSDPAADAVATIAST